MFSSRRGIIEEYLKQGWTVVLVTSDDEYSAELVGLGARLEVIQFNRGGFSMGADFMAGWMLMRIARKWSPSIVHFFHAKPVIMGTLVMRFKLGNSVSIVNTITGLGHAFIRGGLITRFASLGYRKALPKANCTIFQNHDDWSLFLENEWVPRSKTKLITGSGVSLERFSYVDRADRSGVEPVIVMLGRLIYQKGVSEFCEVAKRVRWEIPGARFLWAGEEDPVHPDSIDLNWFKSLEDVGYIGRLSDVAPLLAQADLLLFPSYREGVPRAVMEAAATGLPTIAFDVPGVREVVEEGRTGYLVPDINIEEMGSRVLELLENKELRLELGKNAAELAKNAFDIKAVQKAYLNVYRELGVDI